MKRTLHLRAETLTELTVDQLESVAGGVTSPTCACTYAGCFSLDSCPIPTLPIRTCFSPD